ncbi:MAG: ABC transporter permease [Acidimicrobiales bacterium]
MTEVLTPARVRETSWVPVALALAQRSLVGILRIPAAVVPLIVMPMFFVIAFSGSFSRLSDLPSFPTDNVFNWFVPFAILQGAAFAGFGTGFSTVRDIESGFYDRLLLAPGARAGLFVGPILASLARATFTVAVVLVLGFGLGATLPGGALGLLALWVAALGMAVIATGWALGLVFRVPNQRAGPILQLGIFFTTFLSTGNVPLEDQIGWTRHLARVNPLTNMLELARQGFLGEVAWSTTWPGLVAIAGSAAALWLFAVTGLKKLTP